MTSADSSRPTKARIEPLREVPPELRPLLAVKGEGPPVNVLATLAHAPRVLKRFSEMGGTLLFRGSVGDREREIVILRVGANARSVYEFGQHTVIGKRSGITEAEIKALTQPADEGGWNDVDRALVALADDLCQEDCVSDATWAELAKTWTDAQLVELVVCAGFYRMVSGFLNSAGVQLDDGVPGWPV